MRTILVLTLACLVAAVPAAAQSPGEPLSTQVTTLYAHALDADTSVLYLNTLAEDAEAYSGGVANPGAGTTSWSWTLEGPAAAAQALPLDGQVNTEIYVGGSTASGLITLSWQLFSGSALIAEGADKDLTYIAEYAGATWNVDPAVSEIPAGTLKLVITGSGEHSGAFLSVRDCTNHGTTGRPFGCYTKVDLPIAAGTVAAPVEEGAELIEDVLEGDAPTIALAIEEASNDTYAFSWDHALSEVNMEGTLQVDAGSVMMTVAGADGVLFEQEFAGTVDLAETLAGAGPWTVDFAFTEFVGAIDLAFSESVSEEVEASEEVPEEVETEETSPTEESADGNPTQAASAEEAPGAGLLAILAMVGAALFVRRR